MHVQSARSICVYLFHWLQLQSITKAALDSTPHDTMRSSIKEENIPCSFHVRVGQCNQVIQSINPVNQSMTTSLSVIVIQIMPVRPIIFNTHSITPCHARARAHQPCPPPCIFVAHRDRGTEQKTYMSPKIIERCATKK